jgi:hypothetical protein
MIDPNSYEEAMLQMVSQIRNTLAAEHGQARRLRTLIWVIFWINVFAVVIGGSVAIAIVLRNR